MDNDLFEKGLEQRTATLGKERVEKSMAEADDFNRPYMEAMTDTYIRESMMESTNIFRVLIKTLLFLCAGTLIYLAGTVKLSELSGKLGKERLLSYSFLAGVLSLAGVPLFSGFGSKWIIFVATFEVNPLLTVLAVVSSALTLAYGLKAYSVIFSGNPKGKGITKRIPLSMKIPILLLALIIVIIGIFPVIGVDVSTLMATGLEQAAYIEGVPT